MEAELDATDQLEFAEKGQQRRRRVGIHPQLAALEMIVYPTSRPIACSMIVWPKPANLGNRTHGNTVDAVVRQQNEEASVPVRLTEFSVTEEAFDPGAESHPREVSLGMRVLTVDDVGFSDKAGTLFMSYLQVKEQLAAQNQGGSLNVLGIGAIP